MNPTADISILANEALDLVRPKLIGARFNDYQNTPLFYHAKDVAKLLIDEFGCNDAAAIVAAVMADVNYQPCMDHITCKDLNNWRLHNELNFRFGKNAADAWCQLITLTASEHNSEICDCLMHKNYCSKETHEEQCNDDNCVLERMVRKVSLMTVSAKIALLAWFIFMARKVTGQRRPVDMFWPDVKQYLGKIAIIAEAMVKNDREENKLMISMVEEIRKIVKIPQRRYTA